MKDLLIVDGYNVIHAWPELAELIEEDLEYARDRLIEFMIEFQALSQYRVVVVFDAHHVKGGIGSKEIRNGLEIIYTQEGETADSIIEKKVASFSGEGNIVVATSDWAQQRIIFGKGAVRMPARELVQEVLRHNDKKNEKPPNLVTHHEQSVASRLDKDIKDILEKIRRQKY